MSSDPLSTPDTNGEESAPVPYVYRNSNTGDEVTREERSVRLDHLDNWTLVAEPEEPAGAEDPTDPPQGEEPVTQVPDEQAEPAEQLQPEPVEPAAAEPPAETARPKRATRAAKG